MLGKAMLAGRSGMVKTIVDGKESFILYRPLERTGWSIAIVCPASDVFARYHKLLYSVWTMIGISLLLLLLFCLFTVRKAMLPLEMLSRHAQRIAEGKFDEDLPTSKRQDSVGRLTNSFYLMQRSLSTSVTSIRMDTDELEQRNKELARAYKKKIEADEKKTAYIKNLSHEIRTPLNIISGFTQAISPSASRRAPRPLVISSREWPIRAYDSSVPRPLHAMRATVPYRQDENGKADLSSTE